MISMRLRNAISSFLLVATIALVMPAQISAQDYEPDHLVCKVSNFHYIDTINAYYGTEVIDYNSKIYVYLLQINSGADPDSLAQLILAQDTMVRICEPNYYVDVPEGVQSSSPFLDEYSNSDFRLQPSGSALKLSGAHESSTGAGTRVGIVDGGIDFSHPDLALVATSGFDYIDNDVFADDEPGGSFSGHGTFVAGLVNFTAPNAELRAYRALDTTGRGNGYNVADAIVQAVADSCEVINLSLAMHGSHSAMELAIAYARNNGVIVVAAAGNDSSAVDRYPATDTNAVGVVALDSVNVKADFSNFGNHIDVCAPGAYVFSTYPAAQYARWEGTSFATPFVTGLFALVSSLAPTATIEERVAAVQSSAKPIDSLNPDQAGLLGAGLIYPPAALKPFGGFICGDINQDFSGPDLSDVTFLVAFMFKNGPVPEVLPAVDVNGTAEAINIGDLTYLIEYMFINGAPLKCIR